ncbi:MAG TPA: hypothetical protein VLT82_01880 [Myxococcaceae bacterium]|nr:hypothetical protein [Myxococcaceae bacterium]
MRWAARVGCALVGLGLGGCGGGAGGGPVRSASRPAAAALAGTCSVDGVRIEVEEGVLGGLGGETPCSYSGRFVSVWRAIYQERWGGVSLDSWIVRIRAPGLLDRAGHAGLTWYDERLIELSQSHFELLPHELHHARLGEPSSDHGGWCADFVPWELERNIQDERVRLGCVQ